MGKQAGNNIAALLGMLLGGVGQYSGYKRRKAGDAEEQERRDEEQRRYEEERRWRESQATQRQENADRTFGAQMFARGAVSPDTTWVPQAGARQYEGWTQPPEPEQEMYTTPTGHNVPVGSGLHVAHEQMPGGSLYRPPEPEVERPLSQRDRMNYIMEGWMPEGQATTYDLHSQMPMRDGQPRPVEAGLVAPPMPPPGQIEGPSNTDIFKMLGYMDNPMRGMEFEDLVANFGKAKEFLGGGVTWDHDDVVEVANDQLSGRPVMTREEVLQSYGEAFWQAVEEEMARRSR